MTVLQFIKRKNMRMYMNPYKFIFEIVLFVLLTTPIYGQKKPFSMVEVSKNVYFDETEIDVGSWLSYYSWVLVHKGTNEAQKILPDSSALEPELWGYLKKKTNNFIDAKARYTLQSIGYFERECKECEKFSGRLPGQHKYCAMLAFPITGVTYEQVLSFCKWRTEIEGSNQIVFRLPSPEEWRELALADLSINEQQVGFRDSLNKKGCPNYNFFSYHRDCNNDNYQGELNGIGMYAPGESGAYEVFGNISEMTSIKGLAKGGNFKLHANQCHVDSVQNYTKPEIWLGFRCIAVNGSSTNTQSVAIKNVSLNINTDSKFSTFTDPRDGKTYPTVLIGSQTWLAANLAYKPDSGKYWVYNNEDKYVSQYGYLYTWEMAKDVCPSGWHLPSKSEYETLLNEFGGEGRDAFKELSQGGSSDFNIIGNGFRYNMNYIPPKAGSAYWTSTEINNKKAWVLRTGGGESTVVLTDFIGKKNGVSIRCIKDNE